jgi:hypothetical protein
VPEVSVLRRDRVVYRPAKKQRDAISCFVPSRLLDVQKPVRFRVDAFSTAFYADQAPNVGQYHGL